MPIKRAKETAVTNTGTTGLSQFDNLNIKNKLENLLTDQNDLFPGFDWEFPSSLLNKQQPPATAE